ncbi:hypothetical protein RO3G_10181 [Rhizopus delemar RA 99-880]|uniref:Integrase catalytic domain-containing protein n=1 Tax=Rhizopus delemar (strain RA 99-880 / ATCC MYA-4621 / FGSC 9543 / NRRL 43880) TaxID=246409 RepID=I1CAJ1_RHIO9|nr:hypothetical protein RO3G_10181 [Rhizopus delemar RA 99-880]|eukprot:EIE85471.1 hypothetical protein RO3G_10181 [Rhizopus delemar RA 99-880]
MYPKESIEAYIDRFNSLARRSGIIDKLVLTNKFVVGLPKELNQVVNVAICGASPEKKKCLNTIAAISKDLYNKLSRSSASSLSFGHSCRDSTAPTKENLGVQGRTSMKKKYCNFHKTHDNHSTEECNDAKKAAAIKTARVKNLYFECDVSPWSKAHVCKTDSAVGTPGTPSAITMAFATDSVPSSPSLGRMPCSKGSDGKLIVKLIAYQRNFLLLLVSSHWEDLHLIGTLIIIRLYLILLTPECIKPNQSPAGTDYERKVFFDTIQLNLDANAKIPLTSSCEIPEAVVTLDTVTGQKAYRAPYTIANAHIPTVQKQVDDWLRDKVITIAPPNTEYNSPLFVVPKKGPNDFLSVKKINKKTSFTFNGIQYIFKKAPFSLASVSALVQRTLTNLFADLPYVTIFIDDLTVFTDKDTIHHAECLNRVIKRLNKANMILNTKKSLIYRAVFTILGFTISSTGLSLDPAKASNIYNWPIPRTGRDIQSFLGYANYFRASIPNFSKLTAPLDKLCTISSIEKIWNDAHLKAFKRIQTALSNAPVLSSPNLNYLLYVGIDAGDFSIGGLLYQIIHTTIYYIGFVPRSLPKSERDHSTTKRELLAIVYCFKNFYKWLYGSHFFLYTDHQSLTYLHSQVNPNKIMVNCAEVAQKELLLRKIDVADFLTPPPEERHEILLKTHLNERFGYKNIVDEVHNHFAVDLGSFNVTSAQGNNFFLVLVDLFSRFTVLRPLRDKSAITVAKELVDIFCLIGFPKIIQSDNGKEFIAEVIEQMIKHSGIEHRLSNPYNPLGNSMNERYVGLAKQIIVKRLDGVKNEWDIYLPSVQYAMNCKFARLHNSRPFCVMFNRQPNELIDYSNIQPILHNQTIDSQNLEDKLKDVMDIIIPGLREKISETQRNDNTKFMRKNRIIYDQYPLKSEVMIKNVNRTDKTSERYEGPYTIHGYTKNGSYILMDKTGALLPRNIPTSHIVLISSDNVEPDPNDKQ